MNNKLTDTLDRLRAVLEESIVELDELIAEDDR